MTEPASHSRGGTVAGLILVLALGLLPLAGGKDISVTPAGLWRSDLVKWGFTAALLLVVAFWEGRGLSSIGLRRPRLREVAIGVGAAAGWLLLQQVISGLVLDPLGVSTEIPTVEVIVGLPLLQRASLVVTAAVSEEILFRGFLMSRVEELTGRAWTAVLATVVLFVVAHMAHFGLAANAVQAVLTLGMALLFLWRRDLTAPVVMHLVIDGTGLILLPFLGLPHG